MIKLIACDLDGTLLTSDKTVSPKNLAAIEKAEEQGVLFTIATGRHINSARHFAAVVGANAPLIACNGALVAPLAINEPPVFADVFETGFCREFIDYCLQRGWYIQWYRGEEIVAYEYKAEFFYAYRTVKNFSVRAVGENWRDYADNIVQFVLRDEVTEKLVASLDEINRVFPGVFTTIHNTPREADIMHCGMNKAVGIKKLAAALNISDDEILVMGDAYNDIPMLEAFPHSAVPSDGKPEAIALAEFVTSGHNEDAVATAIEHYICARPFSA